MALDKTNINDGRLRIGQLIRNAREAKKLTCEELGARIGVTRQTISKIENGRYSVGIDTILQIADALGMVWFLEPNINHITHLEQVMLIKEIRERAKKDE